MVLRASSATVASWTEFANQESLPSGADPFPKPTTQDNSGEPLYDVLEVLNWLTNRDDLDVDQVILFAIAVLLRLRQLTLGDDEAGRLLCSIIALRAWGEKHLAPDNLTLRETAEAVIVDAEALRAINVGSLISRQEATSTVFDELSRFAVGEMIELFDRIVELQGLALTPMGDDVGRLMVAIALLESKAESVLRVGTDTCKLLAELWKAYPAKPRLGAYEVEVENLQIGLQRLLLLGIPSEGVRSIGEIEAPSYFDLVLNDLPMRFNQDRSVIKDKQIRHDAFDLIEHGLQHMEATGRSISLVPVSELSGRATAGKRGALVTSGALEAVITPVTVGLQRAILVLRGEAATKPDSPVLFLDARTTQRVAHPEEAIAKALASWRESGQVPELEPGLRGLSIKRSELEGRDGEFSLIFSRVKPACIVDIAEQINVMQVIAGRLIERTKALPDAAALTSPDFGRLKPERTASIRELIATGDLEVLAPQIRIRNDEIFVGSDQSDDAIEVADAVGESAGTRIWAERYAEIEPRGYVLTRPGDVLVKIEKTREGSGRIRAHVETRGGRALVHPFKAVRLRRGGVNGITPLLLKFFMQGMDNQLASVANVNQIRIPVLSKADTARISKWLETLEETVQAASALADEAALAVRATARVIESGGRPE